jgi:hypothetical protein
MVKLPRIRCGDITPAGLFWVEFPRTGVRLALCARLPLFVWRMARANPVTDDSRPRWWIFHVRVVLWELHAGPSRNTPRVATFWSRL